MKINELDLEKLKTILNNKTILIKRKWSWVNYIPLFKRYIHNYFYYWNPSKKEWSKPFHIKTFCEKCKRMIKKRIFKI
jgi:hypothetical protein